MLSVLAFLLLLSILVLMHELGHFAVARAFGVKADEFGFGFPPRAIGFVRENGRWKRVHRKDRKRYAGTVWSLNWLPLGGFVRLKGEAAEDGRDSDSLLAKNGWQKFAILAAGVTMNWIFAAAVFSVGFMIGIPAVLDGLPSTAIVTEPRVQIMEVLPGTAADKAGIKPGDVILAINGMDAPHAEAARKLLIADASSPVTLSIKRGEEALLVNTKQEFLEEVGRPALGVSLSDVGTVRFPSYLAIGEGIGFAAQYTGMIFVGFYGLLKGLVTGAGPSAQISGPVGIAAMTGGIVQQGTWAVAQFAAILSLNLAVINFLPIPALDGGRAAFVIAEAIRRKKNDSRFEARVHQIGFLLLMVLVLLVTLQDVRNYFFR